jgi:Fis family transcriptional regulator, factor for inversion stimulation protein
MTASKSNTGESNLSNSSDRHGLSYHVREAMEKYITDLDGHDAGNLYDLFLTQFEKPMFELVMHKTRGNITKAAQMLGLNRVTLRNRLKKYGLG